MSITPVLSDVFAKEIGCMIEGDRCSTCEHELSPIHLGHNNDEVKAGGMEGASEDERYY